MPAAINEETRKQVIKQWRSCDTRAKIAADNDIGEGTVSNIVSDFKKGIEASDFEAVRELAVESKKHGMTLSDLASLSRLQNFIEKLGADEDQID
jgi:ribosome recycling factor